MNNTIVINNKNAQNTRRDSRKDRSKTNVETCGHCNGTGKDLMNIYNHGICSVCHGKGKVRV